MSSPASSARWRSSRGFSLLEITIALTVAGMLFASLWQLTGVAGQNREAALIINQAMTVTAAAQSYIRGQSHILFTLPQLATLNSAARIKITDADTGHTADSLQSAGYLPADFVNRNGYNQSYALYVRREDGGTIGVADAGDKLVGLLVTTGGNPMSDALGAKISGGMGSAGGFMFADNNPALPANATTVRGSAGGWNLSLGSTGWSTIGSTAKAGRLAVLVGLAPSSGTAAPPAIRNSIDDLSDGITNYTSSYNMFVGHNSGTSATTAINSTAFGYQALNSLTTGNENTAFGANAHSYVWAGSAQNTTIGDYSMSGTAGYAAHSENTAAGSGALRYLGSETANTAIGYWAMYYGNGRTYTTAVGSQALRGTSSLGANLGTYNTVIGSGSMVGGQRQQGHYNAFVGSGIVPSFSGGDYVGSSVALGYQALRSLAATTTLVGQNNIAIGYRAGANLTTGNNNILIGSNVDAKAATANNHINIGNLLNHSIVSGTYSAFTIAQNTGVNGISLDMGTRTDSARPAVGTTAERPVCTSAQQGAMRYNRSLDTFEFCHAGGYWINIVLEGGTTLTTPPGSGFFVLSSTTHNGNLGGMAGANAFCLNDLTANNWLGKADAVSRGQLVASKVQAFLASSGLNNNLVGNTTYYFSRSGYPDIGGAPFTTTAIGQAPNNPSPWSAHNYFGAAVKYWIGSRDYTENYFNLNGCCTGYCSNWGSSSSGELTGTGMSSGYGRERYSASNSYCNIPNYVICMVHP